jgi:hypothetical protein
MIKTYVTIIFSLILTISSSGQVIKTGKYHNFFSSELTLNPDSTYYYSYHFDLSSSWSSGKWAINSDTVYFTNIPIFDTVNYNDSIGNFKPSSGDSLILSMDQISERISSGSAITSLICSGGQNRSPNPVKLFYKKEKLFEVGLNGKLITKRIYCPFRQKKFKPYYIKTKE